jgi:hypothetical protein
VKEKEEIGGGESANEEEERREPVQKDEPQKVAHIEGKNKSRKRRAVSTLPQENYAKKIDDEGDNEKSEEDDFHDIKSQVVNRR